MKYTIDRIENDIVVLETFDTMEMINIKKELLPSNIHEGSIIYYDNNKYIIDEQEEIERRKKIEERFKHLNSE